MTESKSNEKLITSFANKVQDRDKRLDELEQNIDGNNKSLIAYEKERKSILDEAESLINSARQALNYTSAEGISAAFQEQYDIAKNPKTLKNWIRGAVSFLIITLILGIWIVSTASGDDPKLALILGRIALLPLPIFGAIFCGNQYIKQKNIIEDYAYKMVLSKAIVGFSEQLKKNGSDNNEEYIHYIKTALGEIHQDPLRKREKSKTDKTGKSEAPVLKDLVETVEKIMKMTKVEP